MGFFDKRDNDGKLLGYKIYPLQYLIAQVCFSQFKDCGTYKILKDVLSEKLIEIYFKKLFYESALKIACQIILLENDNKQKKYTIKTCFPFIKYLKGYKRFENLYFIQKNQTNGLRNIIKNFIWKNSNLIYFFFKYLTFGYFEKTSKKNNQNKIAVNFLEGCDFKKRNDFFWYNKNLFSHGEVISYVEHENNFKKFGSPEKQKQQLAQNNIKIISYKKFQYFKPNEFFSEITKKIKSEPKLSDENAWSKEHALTLIKRIQFWFNFFKIQNIKIHFNSEELECSNIIRQVALELNNGCSIGKIKSLPTNLEGDFIGFYPNNIFFVWGKDSAKRISKTYNTIQKILISGDPYPTKNSEKDKNFLKKINSMKDNGINFFIMLLDSSHSKNSEANWQLMYSENMENFFLNFLKLLESHKDIGLIIKSKRKNNLKSLNKIYPKIKILEQKQKCLLIDDNNEIAAHYSSYADITVSAGAFIPGTLIQCAINNSKNRAVIYDNTNLRKFETELYANFHNKLIFNDLDFLTENIISLKKSNTIEKKIGLWENIENYDPFMDGEGGKRVGKFTRELLDNLNLGLDSNSAIKSSTENYLKKFGSDKEFHD
jgi:hypothetical protein